MCGIFGYAGERGDAAQRVLDGLKRLEYRGYDSWGIAVAGSTGVVIDRRVGKIGQATTSLPASTVGLGHTRWATHGGVTVANAHPQRDCSGRLAVVHNGMLANDEALRDALLCAGHRLCSQTDTELIAHLIEEALARTPEGPRQLIEATLAAFRRLQGLNAIAVLDVQTGTIAAAKSGSPLVLGFGETAHFLASDPSALLHHTRRMTFVEDGWAVLLERERPQLFEIESGRELSPKIVSVQWDAASSDRVGYPDYMSKEIHEQPAVLTRLLRSSRGHVDVLAACIDAAADVFVVGCGTAAYAGLVAQTLFARVGRRVRSFNASELGYLVQPYIRPGSLLVALSQSGETVDLLDTVRAARTHGAKIAALTNVEGSALWRLADVALPLGAGPEHCVLSTKSFTAKLAFLLLTAQTMQGRFDAASDLVTRAAADIADMLRGERRTAIAAIAQQLNEHRHMYVLGRGPSHALALETALKIKEVSYLHAEGFAGGELKHGVMALIEPGTPCLVLAPSDETQGDMLAGASQLKARGATVIGVGPRRHSVFDHHIEVADLGDATTLVSAVPAQLLGYDLARLRGHDPDMPRNLAKSVTVK